MYIWDIYIPPFLTLPYHIYSMVMDGGGIVATKVMNGGGIVATKVMDGGGKVATKTKTCIYWRRGCCTRRNCHFLHGHLSAQPQSRVWRNPNTRHGADHPKHVVGDHQSKKPNREEEKNQSDPSKENIIQEEEVEQKSCEETKGNHVSTVATLVGHQKAVTGITLPSGSNVLYTGSEAEFVRVWDCNTGKCLNKKRPEVDDPLLVINPKNRIAKKRRVISRPPEEKLVGIIKEEEVEEKSCEESKQACSNFLSSGNCTQGEKCRNLHQWFTGDHVSTVATLVGHQKAVTGIALPSGSNILYTGSEDGFVRTWDCNTGKAGHTQKFAEHSLSGPKGQVYCIEFFDDMLIAGTQDGSLLTWNLDSEGKSFQQGPSLTGHSLAVVSMTVGNRLLYTGSMDKSINVWDVDKFEILQTLTGHASVVMSILCWNRFVMSCSLDNTIKVWGNTENNKIGEVYSRTEEHGLIALKGWKEEKGKPMLLCSCNDNSVCLYDLPSFCEKGRIFSKKKVRSIHIGPGGLVFTGDGAGEVKVWKLLHEEEITAAV